MICTIAQRQRSRWRWWWGFRLHIFVRKVHKIDFAAHTLHTWKMPIYYAESLKWKGIWLECARSEHMKNEEKKSFRMRVMKRWNRFHVETNKYMGVFIFVSNNEKKCISSDWTNVYFIRLNGNMCINGSISKENMHRFGFTNFLDFATILKFPRMNSSSYKNTYLQKREKAKQNKTNKEKLNSKWGKESDWTRFFVASGAVKMSMKSTQTQKHTHRFDDNFIWINNTAPTRTPPKIYDEHTLSVRD